MSVACIFYYQFELRGIHSLESLKEPIHGHHCSLRVGLHPRPEEDEEKKFLLFMKDRILKDFDKADWRKTLGKEPSGENVLQEIAKRLLNFKPSNSGNMKWATVELQETKKNLFRLSLEEMRLAEKEKVNQTGDHHQQSDDE